MVNPKKLKMKTQNRILRALRGRLLPHIEDAREGLPVKLVRGYSRVVGEEIVVFHIHYLGLTLEELKYVRSEVIKDGSDKALITYVRMLLEVTLSEEAAAFAYATTPRAEP